MATVMEKAKKSRTAEKSSFTRTANKLRTAMEKEDTVQEKVLFEILCNRFKTLKDSQQNIITLMIEGNFSEEEIDKEMELNETYEEEFLHLKVKYDMANESKQTTSKLISSLSSGEKINSRKFTLPVIELNKFDGQVKNWFTFWNTFKKIHEDATTDDSDKFQYLLQVMEPGSRARVIVESFPPSGENYQAALACLKSRFGRDELQIEVYVRELLALVLNNIKDNSIPLCTLYDKLESYIRALETLGVTTDKCASMLFPLAESALPQDLLRIWQRKLRETDVDKDILMEERSTSAEIRLKKLMKFLGGEVEDEERAHLAMDKFGLTGINRFSEVPTAAGLLSCDTKVASNKTSNISNKFFIKTNDRPTCIFCEKAHASENCFKAKNMTYEERKGIVNSKKACFICLKSHFARNCRNWIKCIICGKRHVPLMCKNLQRQCFNSVTDKKENSLFNSSTSQVFSQTLVIKLKGPRKTLNVRAVIDTGSQRSYITKRVAEELEYQSIGEMQLTHLLFGGHSEPKKHKSYLVKAFRSDGEVKNEFSFVALDQSIICSHIGAVLSGPWLEELSRLGIRLTDTKDGPLDILIGCDIAGKILTGNKVDLNCGLVAVETVLGWTLMGEVPSEETTHASSVISMLVNDVDLTELWRLDNIGISDPSEKQTKKQSELKVREEFLKTVKILEDGRYEICLPWKIGHPTLQTNYEKARKTLISVGEKLKKDGHTKGYQDVLDDWLRQGIVELVPDSELGEGKHYLSHRPVIKEGSTTRIRPVFNASARSRYGPSLNACLENGENLLENIPSILLRFRLGLYGVTADIKQAFLQISINPRNREYLRFLWLGPDGIQEYRHCRVVFGVINSPYILGAVLHHLLDRLDIRNKYSHSHLDKLRDNMYVDNCVVGVNTKAELHEFIRTSTEVMKEGQFVLRGWEHTGQKGVTKVLGIEWDKELDTLMLISKIKIPDKILVTRRLILSLGSKVFDPLGLSCPVSLQPKLLLQQTWKSRKGWDDEVEEDIKAKFLKWLSELNA